MPPNPRRRPISDDEFSTCRGGGALRTARAAVPRVCVRGRLAAQCHLEPPSPRCFYLMSNELGVVVVSTLLFHLVEKLLVSTSHIPMNSIEVSSASLN